MPKIKTCPNCNQVLFCKACGKRYTPELKGKKRLRDMVDVDTVKALAEEAQRKGISLRELLARKAKGQDGEVHNTRRRRAAADQP